MKLWNDLIPKMMQPLKKAKINFPSSSFIPEPTDETATIADDLKNMNNITIQSFEDKQKEEAEKVGYIIYKILKVLRRLVSGWRFQSRFR